MRESALHRIRGLAVIVAAVLLAIPAFFIQAFPKGMWSDTGRVLWAAIMVGLITLPVVAIGVRDMRRRPLESNGEPPGRGPDSTG